MERVQPGGVDVIGAVYRKAKIDADRMGRIRRRLWRRHLMRHEASDGSNDAITAQLRAVNEAMGSAS